MKYESRPGCGLKEAGKNDGRGADCEEAWRAAINGSAGTEQMETENTDLSERSERTQWWNEQRDGRSDGKGEKEGKKKGEDYL